MKRTFWNALSGALILAIGFVAGYLIYKSWVRSVSEPIAVTSNVQGPSLSEIKGAMKESIVPLNQKIDALDTRLTGIENSDTITATVVMTVTETVRTECPVENPREDPSGKVVPFYSGDYMSWGMNATGGVGSWMVCQPDGSWAETFSDPAVLKVEDAEVVPSNSVEAQVTGIVTSTQTISFTADVSHGAWTILGTNRLANNPIIAGWLSRLKDPAPTLWKYFPNVPNPDVPGFRTSKDGKQVPDGLEYGTYDSPYCSSHPCDIPVGAQEYRYISGNWKFLNMSCTATLDKGCMLVLINEMDQSYTWRNQDVDNGFTVRGVYFNGDALEWAIWGLVSNGSAAMLNMPTFSHPGEVLNAGVGANSGANCGTPDGCKSVEVTVIIHVGDAIVAVATTTVNPTK